MSRAASPRRITSPLTAKGREQARANGRLLKELAGDLSGFDFYASSLHRTCVTMELMREARACRQPATAPTTA